MAGDMSVQEAVKAACSITYVSEKLGVSRPTLYKYMDLYENDQADNLPHHVRRFFSYITSGQRTEEDVILYFLKGIPDGDDESDPGNLLDVKVVSSPGRVMIMFPDADPESTVVRVMVDFGGDRRVIGEYRPLVGMRYVTIDDLIPGPDFFFEVITGGMDSGVLNLDVQ